VVTPKQVCSIVERKTADTDELQDTRKKFERLVIEIESMASDNDSFA
jgi:hypothetical protein